MNQPISTLEKIFFAKSPPFFPGHISILLVSRTILE